MSKLLEKARAAVKKKNYDYALELFTQHLSAYPNEVDVRRELRDAEIRRATELGLTSGGAGAIFKGLGPLLKISLGSLRKNYDSVMIECESYLRNAPRDVKTLLRLGQASRLGGYTDTAVYVLEDVVSLDKNNKTALRALGQLYREKQDFGTSTKFYERLRKLDPSDKEAVDSVRDNAAQIGTRKIQERSASGDFRGMIKDKDKQAELEKVSGRVRTAEQAEDMIAITLKELDESPKDIKLFKRLSELYIKAKKLDQAQAILEKGLSINDDFTLREALGDVRLRHFDEQIGALKDDPAAKDRLAALQHERLLFSVEEFKRRVEDHPTELGLRYDLGKSMFQAGQVDEAIAELQKATKDPRRRLQARRYLGHAFYRKELFDLAIKELNRAVEEGADSSDENFKECTYLLGVIYEKQGNAAESKKAFEQIVEVDYNYRDVVKRLERLGSV